MDREAGAACHRLVPRSGARTARQAFMAPAHGICYHPARFPVTPRSGWTGAAQAPIPGEAYCQDAFPPSGECRVPSSSRRRIRRAALCPARAARVVPMSKHQAKALVLAALWAGLAPLAFPQEASETSSTQTAPAAVKKKTAPKPTLQQLLQQLEAQQAL